MSRVSSTDTHEPLQEKCKMTKNKNTEKYVVKQEQPYVQDVWGILYGSDKNNLHNLYVDPHTRIFQVYASERQANRFANLKVPKTFDDKKIHYKVVKLRAFFAELLPVEVKDDD